MQFKGSKFSTSLLSPGALLLNGLVQPPSQRRWEVWSISHHYQVFVGSGQMWSSVSTATDIPTQNLILDMAVFPLRPHQLWHETSHGSFCSLQSPCPPPAPCTGLVILFAAVKVCGMELMEENRFSTGIKLTEFRGHHLKSPSAEIVGLGLLSSSFLQDALASGSL